MQLAGMKLRETIEILAEHLDSYRKLSTQLFQFLSTSRDGLHYALQDSRRSRNKAGAAQSGRPPMRGVPLFGRVKLVPEIQRVCTGVRAADDLAE